MKSNNRASALSPSGFTLIELLVAVAIVSILAMIAVPNYADYIQRSRIVDATSRLADFRVRMEQYFLDNRTYSSGGQCGIPDPALTGSESFSLSCALNGDRGYLVTARGLAAKGMQDFQYSIDQTPNKKTVSLPAAGWNQANKDTCWITRKDGSCG